MTGVNKKADYLKKHNKTSCKLFMSNVLLNSDKHGWGRGQDNQRLPGPFGRPKDHLWEGREAGQSQKLVADPIVLESR